MKDNSGKKVETIKTRQVFYPDEQVTLNNLNIICDNIADGNYSHYLNVKNELLSLKWTEFLLQNGKTEHTYLRFKSTV